jgi:hypothetical protein
MTQFKDSWLSLVDWSRMKNTWDQISADKQKIILEEGYWSKGKGVFDKDASENNC